MSSYCGGSPIDWSHDTGPPSGRRVAELATQGRKLICRFESCLAYLMASPSFGLAPHGTLLIELLDSSATRCFMRWGGVVNQFRSVHVRLATNTKHRRAVEASHCS